MLLHLEKHGGRSLDESSRYILKSIDLAIFYKKKPYLHEKLYAVLENLQIVEKEDFQLLLSITKQLTIQLQAQSNPSVEINYPDKTISRVTVDTFPFSPTLETLVKLKTVLNNLSIDQKIQNLYTFVDGLWCRLYQGNVTNFTASLLQGIVDLREKHGWEMLVFEYVDELYSERDTSHLIRHLKSCDELVSKGREKTKVIFFDYLSPIDFVKNMFMKDNSFNFQLSDTKYADQQFVLTTNAVKGEDPDTFSMKYNLLHSDRKHLPDMPKLHFAIERSDSLNSKSKIFPISWCGKPTCVKAENYWYWGYIRFPCSELEMIDGCERTGALKLMEHISVAATSKCRLVAFVIN